MTNAYCSARIAKCLWASLAVMVGVLPAGAHVTSGVNCRGCHTIVKNGMALNNFQTQVNLGPGLLAVFQVTAGQTAAIRFSVTNGYSANYGLNVNSLSSAGVNNSANHMTYTPDAAWANRSSGTYFTVGPTTTSPNLWTFNLAVNASTPADYYPVQVQMAGSDSVGRWSQIESFYVQVLSATPPKPTILAPRRAGSAFSVNVATTSGFTYYLEYKTSLGPGSWTGVAQAAGDGTVKILTDPGAGGSQRLYHVRVQ